MDQLLASSNLGPSGWGEILIGPQGTWYRITPLPFSVIEELATSRPLLPDRKETVRIENHTIPMAFAFREWSA